MHALRILDLLQIINSHRIRCDEPIAVSVSHLWMVRQGTYEVVCIGGRLRVDMNKVCSAAPFSANLSLVLWSCQIDGRHMGRARTFVRFEPHVAGMPRGYRNG
jgi:hypothetical protein